MKKLAIITAALFFACAGSVSADWTGKTLSVHDGDTIRVERAGESTKIRVEGIDTPELSQPGGKAARDFARAFCLGRMVRVEEHGKDRYGRIIGTIHLDGTTLQAELLRAGWAWHYKKYNSSQTFADLEKAAQAAGIGIWEEPGAVPPWEWRKMKLKKKKR